MPYQDHFGGEPYAAAFKRMEAELERDPSTAYRQLRDMWLQAQFRREESAALPSPWREFCLSSLEWGAHRSLEAITLLHGASLLAPRWFWMRYYIAELLLRRLDLYALARAEIQAVIQKCPWLWEARCLWTEILMAVGHPEPLKAVRAVAVPEDSRASFLAWRGALELWSGEYALAVRDLDAAAKMDNPDALCWRGGALAMRGKLKDAKRDLDRLLAMDPRDMEGLVWRGEVHRRLGLLPEALKDLDDVIAINGDKPWAHVNRALVYLERKELVEAYREFARVYLPYDDIPGITESPFTAARLKKLLSAALKAGRGCRRSDPHLNVAWMKAAGIALPSRPPQGTRLKYWARSLELPMPPEPVYISPVTDAQVLEAFAAVKASRG